jgi:hypothetical protein
MIAGVQRLSPVSKVVDAAQPTGEVKSQDVV